MARSGPFAGEMPSSIMTSGMTFLLVEDSDLLTLTGPDDRETGVQEGVNSMQMVELNVKGEPEERRVPLKV